MKKTAVLIQAHKSTDNIINLVTRWPDVNFYVHMDKKNIGENIRLKKMEYDNLKCVEFPIDVFWGGHSQVQATLKLIDLSSLNPQNHYFHLISGECLPLIDFKKMENEWDMTPKSLFMEISERQEVYWRLNVKVPYSNTKFMRKFIFRCTNQIYKTIGNLYKFTNLNTADYAFGSQWFSLKREHIDIIIDAKNSGYFNKFVNISCADEHAFQMLFKSRGFIGEGNKRLIIFKQRKSSPEFLNYREIEKGKLLGMWFGRKVKNEVLRDYIYDRI